MTTGAEAEPPRALRLVRASLPLRRAHVAASGTEARREVVLIGWTGGDGVVGWAECPTLSGTGYVTEPTVAAWRALVDDLGPAVLRGEEGATAPRPGLLAAPGALADARLDHRLRAAGRSLLDHLGGRRRPLERCEVLADLGADPAALAGRAERALEAGAALVKVKVAPGRDLEPLTAVTRAVGAGAVAADANGSYSSIEELRVVDGLGLRYLEQPFPPADPEVEARRHAQLSTPVALDESLTSTDAVRGVLAAGAAGVVSVKPARMGGVEAAAAAVRMARDAGVDAFVGGMLELGIGRAAAAAVAALPGCTLPTDLGPSTRYVERDVCAAIVTDAEGRLVLPDGSGIGRAPDEEVLRACTIEEVVLGDA